MSGTDTLPNRDELVQSGIRQIATEYQALAAHKEEYDANVGAILAGLEEAGIAEAERKAVRRAGEAYGKDKLAKLWNETDSMAKVLEQSGWRKPVQ